MAQTVDNYLALRKVCLEIAYDNGCINRLMTEEEWLRDTDEVFGAEGVDHVDLANMNIWCTLLSDEEIGLLAAGEHETEVLPLIARCEAWMPGLGAKLNGLLNDVFDRPTDGSYKPDWT